MVIESERLILREYKDTDVEYIVDGLNNINVSKWMSTVPFPYTIDDAKKFIEHVKNDGKNTFHLAIVLKESNKVIGGTEITNINYKDGIAGGGIWINEKYHGRGYGTEAFVAKIKYCFEILGLRRMENGYFMGNNKSEVMQRKIGYKNEGIRRKRFLCMATNQYVDECITGLLKEEFIDINSKKNS